jgi:hypothetical protein
MSPACTNFLNRQNPIRILTTERGNRANTRAFYLATEVYFCIRSDCVYFAIQVFSLPVFFRARLPEYLLDFGYVVLGTVRTHVVRATNTGWFPVSFKMERGSIHSQVSTKVKGHEVQTTHKVDVKREKHIKCESESTANPVFNGHPSDQINLTVKDR